MQKPTHPVVKLDSFEVAQMVIRSVRCISHGKTNYQSCDRNQTILNSKDLNTLINQKKTEYDSYSERKDHIDQLLTQSIPAESHFPLDEKLENLEENCAYSSSDEEIYSKDHGEKKSRVTPVTHTGKPVFNPSDDDLFLHDDDEEDNAILFKHFIPPSKDGKNSSVLEFSSDRKGKTHSGDLALASVKKGIIIKPGQAIRVNPVKKTKK
jgi:hypothetical protein